MKTTNTLVKQGTLIAALILGSNAWLSAQPNQEQIGQLDRGLGRQQETKTADVSTNSQSVPLMKINKGSSIIGTTVKNQQGEELGKVRDLVIDFNSDRVAYLVLDSEAGVFSAAKLHAVPLRAFQPDAEGASLILNADKDKLERSAGFDNNNWPTATTATWGAEPFWKDAPEPTSTQEKHQEYQQKLRERLIQENKDTGKDLKKIEPLNQP